MQRELAGDAIWKVIIFQTVAALVLSLAALVFAGKQMAISALAGALIIVAGNFSYAWIARRSKIVAKPGGEVLLRHVLAQIAKLLIIFGLMLGAFTSNWFQAGWLLASMGAALLVHWVSLLFLR
jgi:F0F1-type ATP synthase assembly protein I